MCCRFFIGLILIVLAACASSEHREKTMRCESHDEVHSCPYLVGFWQMMVSDENYLVVLENNEDGSESALTVYHLNGKKWEIKKKILSDRANTAAIDGVVSGKDLNIVTQQNNNHALQVVRSPIQDFIDPKIESPEFSLVKDIDISPEQRKKIDLPIGVWWNVITPLSPAEWLFGPKFVRDANAGLQLTANAADGHALLFSAGPAIRELDRFAIHDALWPQAYEMDGRRYVTYIRYKEQRYPFGLFQNRRSGSIPEEGDLFSRADKEQEQNLSADLEIGPIIKFALSRHENGKLWIFALKEAAVGTDVVALEQTSSGWKLAARTAVDFESEELSVEYAHGTWHLIHAVREQDHWAIRYQPWAISD